MGKKVILVVGLYYNMFHLSSKICGEIVVCVTFPLINCDVLME